MESPERKNPPQCGCRSLHERLKMTAGIADSFLGNEEYGASEGLFKSTNSN